MSERKTLCDWDKKDIDENLPRLSKIVRKSKYVCAKCARSAKKEKYLCKPVKLKDQK